MKRAGSISKKWWALAVLAVMLIGLLPLTPMAADQDGQGAELQAAQTAGQAEFGGGDADARAVAVAEEAVGVAGAEATVPVARLTAVRDAAGVTATLYNPSAIGIDASLIFAAYDPDGRLVYMKDYPVTAAAGASAAQRFDYDVAGSPNYVFNVFAWDGDTFLPLSKDVSSARYITIDGSGAVYDGRRVYGNSEVTEFTFVLVDEMTKRGSAYTATKSGDKWTRARADDVDVVIAQAPVEIIGGALPELGLADLREPSGSSGMRVVISL